MSDKAESTTCSLPTLVIDNAVGRKNSPSLRVVTEKAPLMSTDGLYAGAPGRRAPVCVARRLFRITTKTPGAFLSV